MLERGREHQPSGAQEFDPLVVGAAIDIARLADSVAESLRHCPDSSVRRAAAVLTARAHPVLAAFDVA